MSDERSYGYITINYHNAPYGGAAQYEMGLKHTYWFSMNLFWGYTAVGSGRNLASYLYIIRLVPEHINSYVFAGLLCQALMCLTKQ